MPFSSQLAVVAALEREVALLVKNWRVREEEYSGRRFRFFENENVVVVCGGIGPESAWRAAEAVIALYNPTLIYSAGFAGAVDPNSKVGEIIIPWRVVDARDGSSVETGTGQGILVSFASVASPQQKAKLRAAFHAQAVDMEAASVAKAAAARGIRFAAIKAISDPSDFALPPLDNFIASDGTFRAIRFALFMIPRPWMWRKVVRLQKHSVLAARALCQSLRGIGAETDVLSKPAANSAKITIR
jgi:adenosylhomocysteine nucleosidase